MTEWMTILQDFSPITLAEMKAVKLMNRVDTKYLVNRSQLALILKRLKNDFSVQISGNQRMAHYKTLYYDTEDVKMYLAHHDKKLNRQKLRARLYCNSQEAFCEVKNKNNKGRTKKKRIPMDGSLFDHMLSNVEVRDFVKEKLQYAVELLKPQVENEFDRITLVNLDKTERLTMDCNLSFVHHQTGVRAEVPYLAIIELKQEGNSYSFFQKVAADLRIHPYRISKYCLGTVLTNSHAKNNRFKQKLRYIERLRFIK
ncbi:MAG: polyphosphate polymerase domain-containing protein [Bacteroidales bacterium]|nr:polyphosphate polymerase domain-containing protein [Bacteroidales bacterium]